MLASQCDDSKNGRIITGTGDNNSDRQVAGNRASALIIMRAFRISIVNKLNFCASQPLRRLQTQKTNAGAGNNNDKQVAGNTCPYFKLSTNLNNKHKPIK